MAMKKTISFVSILSAALCFAGVEKSQIGNLHDDDLVVTGVSLNATDVNALPNNEESLVTNENFKAAVERVSPPVELPEKWALANVTNAQGRAVSAADVGALPSEGDVDVDGDLNVYGDIISQKSGGYILSDKAMIETIEGGVVVEDFLNVSGTMTVNDENVARKLRVYEGQGQAAGLHSAGDDGIIELVGFPYMVSGEDGKVRYAQSADTVPWGGVRQHPATLSGYGITDAASASALTAHTSNMNNPHSVTAAQVGAYTKSEADAAIAAHHDNTKRDLTDREFSDYVSAARVGSGGSARIEIRFVASSVHNENLPAFEIYGPNGYMNSINLPSVIDYEEPTLATLDDIPTSFAWQSVSGKPTTISGYGITDAYTKSETDANFAKYHEYGYPFLGRQDLMVKDAMVVGTTNYTQRAQHTEYCDGSIQNEAMECYLYLPYGKAGNIAVEDPFEVSRLMSIAATNEMAKAATCSAICTATESQPHFAIIDGEIHIITITEGRTNE